MTDYLREQTLLRNLDQPGHMGRIWRIVPKGHSQYQKINLPDLSDQDLISTLDHSDGWYRDMAQRLLVERGDSSLVTLIEEFIDEKSKTDLGRIHALWTLEGLDVVDSNFLLQSFSNSSDGVRRHILRILEKAAEKDKIVARELGKSLIAMSPFQDEGLALQAALTASVLQNSVKFDLLKSILEDFGSEALFRDAVMSSLEGDEFAFLSYLQEEEFLGPQSEPKAIFLETLALAVVQSSDPGETSSLLNFIASKSTHWSSEAVLSALAIQGSKAENQGKFWLDQEPELFQLTEQNQQLTRAKNLFRWEGFSPDRESNDVLTLDAQSQVLFADGRQKYLTSCAGCHASNGAGVNRMGPPLVGSEWVTGDERRLALILLHGIEGPISVNGKEYDAPEILPVMPSHSTMDDGSIAAILTYIRNEWGNQAGPISPRLVGGTRHTSQGRVYPWSADELNAHIAKLNQEETKPNPKP
jgi:mono/diheme cytochrome c family protein